MTGPILVTVIGGYLGSGKTTLVNHVLRSADDRIAVLVNDFGAVNIDADLIESDDGSTISLSNGCICCSLVDGFGHALDSIRAITPLPERLVIEASGVANPAQVAAYAHGPGLSLAGVVTVIDAEQIGEQRTNEYVGDVVQQQIDAADVLVVNKCDLVEASQLDVVVSWLAAETSASVIPAIDGIVPLDLLLGSSVSGKQQSSAAASNGAASDRVSGFVTWTESFVEPIDRQEFEHRLGNSPDLIRAKGFVRFTTSPDTRHLAQLVGGRWSITLVGEWFGEPSNLVCISTQPRPDRCGEAS